MSWRWIAKGKSQTSDYTDDIPYNSFSVIPFTCMMSNQLSSITTSLIPNIMNIYASEYHLIFKQMMSQWAKQFKYQIRVKNFKIRSVKPSSDSGLRYCLSYFTGNGLFQINCAVPPPPPLPGWGKKAESLEFHLLYYRFFLKIWTGKTKMSGFWVMCEFFWKSLWKQGFFCDENLEIQDCIFSKKSVEIKPPLWGRGKANFSWNNPITAHKSDFLHFCRISVSAHFTKIYS